MRTERSNHRQPVTGRDRRHADLATGNRSQHETPSHRKASTQPSNPSQQRCGRDGRGVWWEAETQSPALLSPALLSAAPQKAGRQKAGRQKAGRQKAGRQKARAWRDWVAAAGLVCLLGMIVLVAGCERGTKSSEVPPPPQRPLRAMDSAIRRGQLAEAWTLADRVIAEHGDDSETVAKVAWLAHENGQPEKAAELLERACRVEDFASPTRVQQAMVAMVGTGRLYDGLALLEEALQTQPMQHETRRWLYDLYMGSENRQAGLPHGRFLVRQRQFDVALLMGLSNTEYRTLDAKPLQEMTARNPDDKRPLLGDARHKFDERDFEAAIEILQSIVATHPNYLPAQGLLGRSLAGQGSLEGLESWAERVPDGMENHPDYWLALGDWARAKNLQAEAARAYWEATRCDPDVMESWSKLSMSLRQLQLQGETVSEPMLETIDRRAALLSSFNQLKQKFERTGGVSRETAAEIVEVLRDLGRLWEAEAWASIALTLPEDDSVPAEQLRDSVVALMNQETPWQTVDGFPELQLDLTNLRLPSISSIAAASKSAPPNPASDTGQSVDLSLINEASERGLTFFGRTSDTLDQPGIMLYQTLGCGGGTLDFDLDGWSDLYLSAAGGTPPQRDSSPNALIRNLAGQFVNVTEASVTGDTGFGQGVAVGDLNDDGFSDLLVLNYGPNVLLINNGDGTFTDASDRLGTNGDDWSASGAIADVDGDGISDLVVVNYCDGLEPVTVPCPMKNSDISRSCSPVKFPAAPDRFLQGTSDGRFVDRTTQWAAEPKILGRGLGIVVGSLDATPGVDVFVANDMTNNHYWSAKPGSESFQLAESAMLRGLGTDDRALAQGSMGIATGDFDRDGDVDFYVTNFDKEYNTYHEQRDSGIWQDVTSAMGLVAPTMPLVGFGTEAVDLNLDGQMELVVANGHVDMFSRGDERSLYEHPMQVFRRTSQGSFESIGDLLEGEYLSTPHVGRALWTIDANQDGRTDFVVTHQTEPVALLINHSKVAGNHLAVRLVARNGARDAVGAVVEVRSGDDSWTAFQLAGDGYFCSNERILRFGLGSEVTSCDLRIRWPDGSVQLHPGLEVNQTYLVIESDPQAFAL